VPEKGGAFVRVVYPPLTPIATILAWTSDSFPNSSISDHVSGLVDRRNLEIDGGAVVVSDDRRA